MFNNPIDFLIDLLSTGEMIESEQYCRLVQQGAEKLKPAVIHQFYSIEEETKQKSFIRNFHAQLIVLSDKLFDTTEKETIDNPGNNRDSPNAQQSVFNIIENLLVFTWDKFSVYCDKDQKMPKGPQIIFIGKISEELERLSLPENDPDHILYEKVKMSVQNRLNEDKSGVSYGFMVYLNEFVKEIEKVRSSNKENSFLITLREVLIIFNFNTFPVVHHLISMISEDAGKTESIKDKIECLSHWLKDINQVPVKPNYAFDIWHDTMGQFLSNAVREEIQFYEKNLRLFSGTGYPAELSDFHNATFKFETEMSVTQIACLSRLFMDSEVIKNANIRELLNFLAKHIRSKRQDNISAESLRMKYYNIEEGTREEVQKIIKRLLTNISHPM
ncbi:MAG: hypothetical protein GZ094_18410 [Mariniphaga sp.]|nr:hypothetical protein [Mariniphaga sp.]